MSEKDSVQRSEGDESATQSTPDELLMEEILQDPERRKAWMERFTLAQPVDGRTPSGMRGGRDGLSTTPTPSGKARGEWSWPPVPSMPFFWPPAAPGYPPSFYSARPPPPPPGAHAQGVGPGPSWAAEEPSASEDRQPGEQEAEEGEVLELLDEAEALELVEFDPSVDPKESWDPPKIIERFIEKHFNRSLTEPERQAIMKDFPKPKIKALTTPTLDDQFKDHLKRKGKDPHFGAEKSLYKIQSSLLDVAGPLSCLWFDLLTKDSAPSKEQTLLLAQQALVLLGSAANQISTERRRVAWGKINPKLKGLAEETYTKW